MKRQYLLTPGPTPVPEEVIKAMAQPIIHHRTPQYKDFTKDVTKILKRFSRQKIMF